MCGVVNHVIQRLVEENFGKEKWLEIKKVAGVEIDYFINDEAREID
jgi:hypothetical protein